MYTELMDEVHVPFTDSYWVLPGRFLAGAFPGYPDFRRSNKNFSALLTVGINTFINLKDHVNHTPGEYGSLLYPPVLFQLAEKRKISLTIRHHPITDFSVPTVQQMTRILDDIDRLLLTSKMVYLHCHAGLGRTGTVVGCYLARHAMATGQSALDRITHLRRAIPGSGRSPETKAQADFVVSWQPGE